MTRYDSNPGIPVSRVVSLRQLRLADPSLIWFDGLWWLYPTSDGFENWASNSFRAYSSPDLVSWTDEGEILRLGRDVNWASERAWAPAMFERNGRFYFFFTANHNIGVAVGDSPKGPFRDLGKPLVSAGQFEGSMIDPSVFEDQDGAVYLYWGNQFAYGVKLNDDLTSFQESQVVSWSPLGYREAAWVHRREGTYYLSWSENDTRSEDYRVRYATGSSPLGPWTHRGILAEKSESAGILGTGHHCILRVPDSDRWLIGLHRFAIPNGNGYNREVFFAELQFDGPGLMKKVLYPSEAIHISLVDSIRP